MLTSAGFRNLETHINRYKICVFNNVEKKSDNRRQPLDRESQKTKK